MNGKCQIIGRIRFSIPYTKYISNDKININFERDALIDLNLYYVLMEKYLNNGNHQPVNGLPNMDYVWFHFKRN